MKKAFKTMLISGLSYNEIVAMERLLLWYTDQTIHRAGTAIAQTQDLGDKLSGLKSLSEEAAEMLDLHQAILNGLGQAKSAKDFKEDAKELNISFPEDQFAYVATALNSPFCRLRSTHEGNFWRNLEQNADPKEIKVYRRLHADVIKALKSAVTLVRYEETDDDEQEEAVSIPLRDSFATMPTPSGHQ